MTAVIDAAALMAVLLDEAGHGAVLPVLYVGTMSAINVSECCSRAVERGAQATEVIAILGAFDLRVVAFGLPEATRAAALRPVTRHVGASLGDRACLDLGQTLGLPMYMADRKLGLLDIGVDIRLIR